MFIPDLKEEILSEEGLVWDVLIVEKQLLKKFEREYCFIFDVIISFFYFISIPENQNSFFRKMKNIFEKRVLVFWNFMASSGSGVEPNLFIDGSIVGIIPIPKKNFMKSMLRDFIEYVRKGGDFVFPKILERFCWHHQDLIREDKKQLLFWLLVECAALGLEYAVTDIIDSGIVDGYLSPDTKIYVKKCSMSGSYQIQKDVLSFLIEHVNHGFFFTPSEIRKKGEQERTKKIFYHIMRRFSSLPPSFLEDYQNFEIVPEMINKWKKEVEDLEMIKDPGMD